MNLRQKTIKGRKFRKVFSLLTACTLAVSIFSMPLNSSAAARIQSNVSRTEVSANISNRSLPSDAGTLNSGESYFFNLAGDSGNKFKTAWLYVKQPGESSFNCVYTYTANNYFRYTSKKLQVRGNGTLQYYWKIKYSDNGRTESFKTNNRTVKGSASTPTNTNRQDAAINWCKSKVGSSLDYDGYYGCQCVDLIKYYYKYLGKAPVTGNGKDYTWNSLPSGWSRIKGAKPQKGDILVFTNGKNGHVAIYASDSESYHQNYNSVQKVQMITKPYYNMSGYWGVIRPAW